MSTDKLSGRQLVTLKNQIVSNFNSSDWLELGALTETLDFVSNHSRLLRSLSWNDEDYEGHALAVLKHMLDCDPNNTDIILNYVSRKYPESGEFISSHNDDSRRIVFCPIVFKVPTQKPNPNLISIMMPFDSALRDVYEAIKSAAKIVNFQCKRVDDLWDDSTIVQDIFSLIYESYIVVCDFTGKNANVFYEAGIAHTLGKHVVPITQNSNDIPFDLQHHRYIHYLNNNEGLGVLQRELSQRFQTLAEKRTNIP